MDTRGLEAAMCAILAVMIPLTLVIFLWVVADSLVIPLAIAAVANPNTPAVWISGSLLAATVMVVSVGRLMRA